jgi:hypothetical protein
VYPQFELLGLCTCTATTHQVHHLLTGQELKHSVTRQHQEGVTGTKVPGDDLRLSTHSQPLSHCRTGVG